MRPSEECAYALQGLKGTAQADEGVVAAVPEIRARTALLSAGAILTMGLSPGPAATAQEGEALFRTNCAPCHSLGTNRIVGPGLAGVTERRDHDWLIRKITDPEGLAGAGDPITLSLIEEHNMAMVGLGITAAQAQAILAWLPDAEAPPSPEGPAAPRVFAPEQVELGRRLDDPLRPLGVVPDLAPLGGPEADPAMAAEVGAGGPDVRSDEQRDSGSPGEPSWSPPSASYSRLRRGSW